MRKFLKLLLVVLCLFTLCSCKKKNGTVGGSNNGVYEEVEYISFPPEELEKLDSYNYKTNIDNISYNYTYYFKEDKCVASKEELTFTSSELAQKYYNELKESNETIELKINGNKVTYYLKSEYFEYLLYPKDSLIDLLNSNELE